MNETYPITWENKDEWLLLNNDLDYPPVNSEPRGWIYVADYPIPEVNVYRTILNKYNPVWISYVIINGDFYLLHSNKHQLIVNTNLITYQFTRYYWEGREVEYQDLSKLTLNSNLKKIL